MRQTKDRDARKENRSAIQPGLRVLINLFLMFHLAAVVSWCIPIHLPIIDEFRQVIRPYMLWSGLFQSWDTFAPAPKAMNSYVEATVIYRDGRTRDWKFPRMEQLSPTERYSSERYRKFVENVKEDSNVGLWADVARRIARLNNDPSNPPEIVMLVRHWSDIVPNEDGSYQTEPWHVQIFYEYDVKAQDLE